MVPQVSTAGANAAFDLGGPLSSRINQRRDEGTDDYPISFNWPYDYVSFVELVKFEVEVLYENPGSAVTDVTKVTVGDVDISVSNTSPSVAERHGSPLGVGAGAGNPVPGPSTPFRKGSGIK